MSALAGMSSEGDLAQGGTELHQRRAARDLMKRGGHPRAVGHRGQLAVAEADEALAVDGVADGTGRVARTVDPDGVVALPGRK